MAIAEKKMYAAKRARGCRSQSNVATSMPATAEIHECRHASAATAYAAHASGSDATTSREATPRMVQCFRLATGPPG